MNKLAVSAVLGAAMAVAGCGGGGDDTPPVTAQVPVQASASIGGFIDYLKALVVSDADSLDPVDVSAVMPPTDETSAPAALD